MCDGRPVGAGEVNLDADAGWLWVWAMPCGATQAGTSASEQQAWADMERAIQDWYGALQ